MQHKFDVLVIGSGTAGYTLALACRKAGLKVAVVDDKPFGGTCGARGCEPEKFLVVAAELVQLSQQMSETGIHPSAQLDWPALVRSVSAFTTGVPDRAERGLESAGVNLFLGSASFVSREVVSVGGGTTVRANAIVIATGAKTADLDFPGADLAITAQDFMELPVVPRRVLFIGGGCLAMALAPVARGAGAAVTILNRGERILKKFDADLAKRLANASKDAGMNIVTGITASMAEKYGGAFLTYGKAGCAESFPSDLIVNTSGRVASLEKLNLRAGEVTASGKGVTVNEFLQSVSNPRVWAIGDACDSPYRLTSVAHMEGDVAAENIINGNVRRPDYSCVPCVVSSFPPIAQVGMTEQQAAEAGIRCKLNRGAMESWPSSRRIGQKHGYYKVLIEQESRKIVGAHILGHNAGETINIFAMAVKFGLTTRDLLDVLWAYPTDVSDIKEMIA
ncbi:NAD(P)/FAD-dependent oxidoreductase [Geomonas sp.]|uniref:dihydrolipoyl dehydrogenase family protein n=1 Tax=Geomonas sp. TaxID=2651584 RepID=UPI002B49CFCE|nr:NAD(P)/FAD-dependent oxidoreductase [Geomonas sp.]HJV36623.1 NAD(P)/FAD-dependent oxidoreductase [Geomonas sp.]